MTQEIALITGITGQDGAYLAGWLLEKGYAVHGLKRRSSASNTSRLQSLGIEKDIHLHEGDLSDMGTLVRLMETLGPDEVYNLAAQSHVHTSFIVPEHTADVNGLGVLRLLEAIRLSGKGKSTRFYQASTSELYGLVQEVPQKETTPFHPRSPYAVAKLFGYWTTVNYREAYGMFACNGILFNHESPLRGDEFVTKKIVKGVVDIVHKRRKTLRLGNLDARRDWGYAPDFVEGMWKILQAEKPSDYVLATGIASTVRQFVEWSFQYVDIKLRWSGTGPEEKGIDTRTGEIMVEVVPQYYRPSEVEQLLGDPSKAWRELDWKPKKTVRDIVSEMMRTELQSVKR